MEHDSLGIVRVPQEEGTSRNRGEGLEVPAAGPTVPSANEPPSMLSAHDVFWWSRGPGAESLL